MGLLWRGIQINRAGRMGLLRRGIRINRAGRMEVAAQHRRKRWPNEAKWRRGIDKRAAQMDGMGAWHR